MIENEDPREALKRAHVARTTAERAHDAAAAATERGRGMLAKVVGDLEALDAVERRNADDLADRLRSSIAKGVGEVKFAPDDKTVSRNLASRAELQTRRIAIERTVADLAAAECEAEQIHEDAKAEVEKHVAAVMRAEADRLAQRWAAVDAEARRLRFRLGRDGNVVDLVGALQGRRARDRSKSIG